MSWWSWWVSGERFSGETVSLGPWEVPRSPTLRWDKDQAYVVQLLDGHHAPKKCQSPTGLGDATIYWEGGQPSQVWYDMIWYDMIWYDMKAKGLLETFIFSWGHNLELLRHEEICTVNFSYRSNNAIFQHFLPSQTDAIQSVKGRFSPGKCHLGT